MKKKLAIIPGLKVPSHDTVGRIMQKVSTKPKMERNITKAKEAKISFTHYDDNIPMNELLVKSTKLIGALKENVSYTMDIDATFINTLKRGALRILDKNGNLDHGKIGFNPMICLIGSLPVFISMRSGNAAANFRITECLESSLKLLEESKIKVGRIISDAAGFTKTAMALIDNKGIKFNMRFIYKKNYIDFNEKLQSCSTWRETEIETANFFWDCEVADIPHKMSKMYYETEDAKDYRVVALRIPTDEMLLRTLGKEEIERRAMIKEKMKILAKKKILKEEGKPYEDKHWKVIGDYQYKFYITNDYDKTCEEIIIEYNKRGGAERKFSFLKDELSYELPPFAEMNHNTVFLIVAALANNIFRGVLELFKDKVPGLKLTNRLPEFRELFINVACTYIRDTFVFFSQDILYDELMI
ncbi:MAG: hypothetical protein JWO44_2644 [Bacteroidetes bacterium]|nr:hypothetical protein [Bacteroidota bacterium]